MRKNTKSLRGGAKWSVPKALRAVVKAPAPKALRGEPRGGVAGGSQGAGRPEPVRGDAEWPAPKALRAVVKGPAPKLKGAGIKIGRPRHSLEKTTEVASCPAGQILVLSLGP